MIFYRLAAAAGTFGVARGWTYEAIGQLSLAQLRNELNQGKPSAPVGKVGARGAKALLAQVKAGKWK